MINSSGFDIPSCRTTINAILGQSEDPPNFMICGFKKEHMLNVIHYFSEFVSIFGTLKDDQIQLNVWEKMIYPYAFKMANFSTKNVYSTAQFH